MVRTWEAFWVSEGSTFSLGLFRILFALLLYREMTTTLSRSLFAVEGGFHLPYLSFIQPLTLETYLWLHDLQYPFILLLGLGIWMRFSCGTLLLLQGYVFFADQLNFRNHPYFFLLVLFLLLFSPADDALSVKALFRMLKERRPVLESLLGSTRRLTFQRLIQVQVCFIYLYAALHKLNPGFLRGEILSFYLGQQLESAQTGRILGRFLQEESFLQLQDFVAHPPNLIVLVVLSVTIELLLPVFLWIPKARPAAILVGTLFHLGIAFSMDIHVFSYAIIASYLLFLDPKTLPEMVRTRLRDQKRSGERFARGGVRS